MAPVLVRTEEFTIITYLKVFKEDLSNHILDVDRQEGMFNKDNFASFWIC